MLTLLDDGTLDTVLHCDECDQEIRYSEADRDDNGEVLLTWIEQEEQSHDIECSKEVTI